VIDRLEAERSMLRAWGEVIRRYRQWKQLSRRELAQRAGLSPVFLGEIERGEKDPSAHTLSLVADGLGVPLAELFLRVAARLDGLGREIPESGQTAVPLGLREAESDYLTAVSAAKDETAFDLYKIVRVLPADQQVSLLVLAQSLLMSRHQTTSEAEEQPAYGDSAR
jgi:transcriptional regulator with XRE-family HTH domain